MKTYLVVIALFVAFIATGKEVWAGNVAVNINYLPKYVANATGQNLLDRPVANINIFAGHDSGLYADAFGAAEVSDHSYKPLEVDLGFGWGGSALGLELNASSYVVAFDGAPAPVIWNNASLTRKFGELAFYVGYDGLSLMPYASNGWDTDNVWNTGVKLSGTPRDRITVNSSATLAYDCQGLGSSYGFLAKGSAGITWKFDDSLSFTLPKIDGFLPLSTTDGRVAHLLVSAGIILSK